MKLCVHSAFMPHLSFEEALRFVRDQGAVAVEVDVSGGPTANFCDPDKLVDDKDARRQWLDQLKAHGLEVAALCAHGEPLSPNKKVAEDYSKQLRNIYRLAEGLGVERIVVVTGLPEGAPGDTCPCWIVDSFTPQSRAALRYQWEERLIPYWREHVKMAQDHGCKLCFEPQVGMMVHSPKTFKRFREALGSGVGCNLDPGHLFVQQIDVLESIRYLGSDICHVHIKDSHIDPHNVKTQGLLDTTSYAEPEKRSWNFTLVGWGHDPGFWRDFITALRHVGYEGALSVEMESDYMDITEGLTKAIQFIRPMVLEKPPGKRWWEHLGMSLKEH